MSDLRMLERCVGDYRIVYECLMAYDHQVRVPDVYGDFSHYDRKQRTWHVIAVSQALAEAAWTKEHGWPGSKNELLHCIPVLAVDREVSIR